MTPRMTPRTLLEYGCKHVERVVNVALFALLALLVVTVWIQVFGRLLLNSSPLWTVDYATLFMMWATLLGAAAAVRKNAHFTIDIGVGRSHLWDRFTMVASAVIVIVILGFLLVAGTNYAVASAGRLSGMTEVSMAYYIAAIPTGAALMLLFAVDGLLRDLQTSGGQPDEVALTEGGHSDV